MADLRTDTCAVLERKLGLIEGIHRKVSPRGFLDRTLQGDISSITYLHHGIYQTLRSDDELNAKINDLFDQYGPTLWPTAACQRAYVVAARTLDQPLSYPRDLYFDVSDDREQLLALFRAWIYRKCYNKWANRYKSRKEGRAPANVRGPEEGQRPASTSPSAQADIVSLAPCSDVGPDEAGIRSLLHVTASCDTDYSVRAVDNGVSDTEDDIQVSHVRRRVRVPSNVSNEWATSRSATASRSDNAPSLGTVITSTHPSRLVVLKIDPEKLNTLVSKEAAETWILECEVCGTKGDTLADGSHSIAYRGYRAWQHVCCHAVSPKQTKGPDGDFLCLACTHRLEKESRRVTNDDSGTSDGEVLAQRGEREDPNATRPHQQLGADMDFAAFQEVSEEASDSRSLMHDHVQSGKATEPLPTYQADARQEQDVWNRLLLTRAVYSNDHASPDRERAASSSIAVESAAGIHQQINHGQLEQARLAAVPHMVYHVRPQSTNSSRPLKPQPVSHVDTPKVPHGLPSMSTSFKKSTSARKRSQSSAGRAVSSDLESAAHAGQRQTSTPDAMMVVSRERKRVRLNLELAEIEVKRRELEVKRQLMELDEQ